MCVFSVFSRTFFFFECCCNLEALCCDVSMVMYLVGDVEHVIVALVVGDMINKLEYGTLKTRFQLLSEIMIYFFLLITPLWV